MQFTRVLSLGLESLATELAQRRGLTLEHARGWLQHVGLSAPVEAVEGQPELVADARHVLADGVRRIADEVRTTLDFHRAQSGAGAVGTVVLTGPAAALAGFPDQFGQALGLELEVGAVTEARPGAFGALDGARLAVAAGLTVAETT